jgi:glycerol-3-phosphate cytidylyltransferase
MTMVGYTAGVFDLFHIGHVNILRGARALCDRLIVGVSTDEVVQSSPKMKTPVIPFEERVEVVRACRFVDLVVPQTTLDKREAFRRLKFSILFVGDDWFSDPSWELWEHDLNDMGAEVVYLPYTVGQSSTRINKILEQERELRPGT